jgi:hypothetical protein
MVEKKRDEFSVTTPVFRLSFPELAEKKLWAGDEAQGKEPKFSLRMNFPKNPPEWFEIVCPGNNAQKEKLKAAIAAAVKGKWGEKKVVGLKMPIKDGDNDPYAREEEAGFFFANATSKFPISCVDQKKNELIGKEAIREVFYPGCWVRASVKVSAYDKEGKGVAFYIQGVQKVRDDEPLVGQFSADTAFDAIEGETGYSEPDLGQPGLDEVPF